MCYRYVVKYYLAFKKKEIRPFAIRKLLEVKKMPITLWWWFHECMDISKLIKLYTLNMCSFVYQVYLHKTVFNWFHSIRKKMKLLGMKQDNKKNFLGWKTLCISKNIKTEKWKSSHYACPPPFILPCLREPLISIYSQVTWYIFAVEQNGAFSMSHEEQTQEVDLLNLSKQPWGPKREWREIDTLNPSVWKAVIWRGQKLFCVTLNCRSIAEEHSKGKY